MQKQELPNVWSLPFGDRREVTAAQLSDGAYCLEFQKPIEEGDVRDGVPRPTAITFIQEDKIVTRIFISQEAAMALKTILSVAIRDPSPLNLLERLLAENMFAIRLLSHTVVQVS